MKNIIFLLLICFALSKCSAQTRLLPGELKGKHEILVVEKPKLFDSLIVVYSKTNKYNNGIPYPKVKHLLPIHENADIHIDKNAVRGIIFNVLRNKLNALKQNKERIDVDFTFHPNGELTDIGFGLHANTLITLQDIEEIDERLRATIKATFTGRAYLQYEAIRYPVLPSIAF